MRRALVAAAALSAAALGVAAGAIATVLAADQSDVPGRGRPGLIASRIPPVAGRPFLGIVVLSPQRPSEAGLRVGVSCLAVFRGRPNLEIRRTPIRLPEGSEHPVALACVWHIPRRTAGLVLTARLETHVERDGELRIGTPPEFRSFSWTVRRAR